MPTDVAAERGRWPDMTREKRPDDLAREAAPEPREPIGTPRAGTGIVKWWRDTKGYGVIACSQTAPWDIWCHFSAIEGEGFRSLETDESVDVEYHRFDRESFKYVATKVRRRPAGISNADSRVTIHMVASLDGFIARKDGSVDWLETADQFVDGESLDPGFVEAFLESIDCYVMGSRTYETAL